MLKCAAEKSNMLDIFFTQESPNKLPVFMQCNIDRESHNNPLYNRRKPIIFSTDGKQDKCTNDVFGNRFYGFSKNIDVDSELKRINRIYDRCNNNNFKLNPNDERSPLFCNRDMLLVGDIKNDIKKEKNDSPMICNRWNL
jgi:hypothetical protein